MTERQPVDRLNVAAYTIPTEAPESDGTMSWSETTLVTVRAGSGPTTGLGFSYATGACVTLVRDVLHDVIVGADVMDVSGTWEAMVRAIRNIGRPGVASMAIAAVDTALWDLKARVLDLPLVRLLGQARPDAPVYGSGGFTSYTDEELVGQLSGWVHEQQIPRVKMKIGTGWGTEPDRDVERVRRARRAIGDDAALFVDANGAYTAKQALRLSRVFEAEGVTWFEEPVSSDDLAGLALISSMTDVDVAAGEYGYDLPYFARMCAAGAVDVLQADVSRCAGFTEWLRVAAVAAARGLQISGHCAQSLHVHVACAVPNLRHLEYFADHARLDRMAFDGVLDPAGGRLRPALDRPGMGLELREADIANYRTA